MNKEFFKKNRAKLMENIKDNSLVILFAGEAPKKTADEMYPFTPNRNFYYLTGVEEQNHILLMSKINNEEKSILFIKDIDPIMEKWEGKTLREEEAINISAVESVKFKSSFFDELHRIIENLEEMNLYLDLSKNNAKATGELAHTFANEMRNKYPQINIKNVYSAIGKLRLVKDKEEVENIKKAIEITISGVEMLMNNSRAGMKEYELEAYFDFNCKKNGVKDFAFKTIAATGKNATILHYVDNNSELAEGELIQFDLGAQYKYYNADISRAFPVNGKFTERQKEVYNAVLRVNEKIIDAIKPGVKYKDINDMATDLIAQECIGLGLISDKKDVRKYYYHSIGHSLGLDTHDIETPHRDIVFEEGVIFTVEPGIYIEEEGIGVRIEDDILVTKDSVVNLTENMIKTVEEIENFMSKNNTK